MSANLLDAISPYPWRAGDHGDGAAINDAEGRRIASLRYSGSSISAKVTVEQAHANQQLMVAAPQLASACVRALEVIDSLIGLRVVSGPTFEGVRRQLREALVSAGPPLCERHGRVRAGVCGECGDAVCFDCHDRDACTNKAVSV